MVFVHLYADQKHIVMQKFLFLLCMVVLCSLQLPAQISTSIAEKYTHWTVVKTMNCNYMPPGTKGSAQTWDFTTLTPKAANDTDRVQHVPREISFPFPTANMAKKDGNDYTFYEYKADGVYEIGIFDSITLDTIFYPNSKRIMKHPTTYLDKYIDTFTIAEAGDTVTGVLVDTVESFGILKLPNGTHENVIRKRSEETITGFSGGNPVNVNRISYRWYDKDHRTPLLRIDSVDINGAKSRTTVYLLKEDPVMVRDAAIAPMVVTAIFSGNELVVTSGTEKGQQYNLVLYNLAGTKIYQNTFVGGEQQRFSINNALMPGMYILTMDMPDKPGHAGITKLIKP